MTDEERKHSEGQKLCEKKKNQRDILSIILAMQSLSEYSWMLHP